MIGAIFGVLGLLSIPLGPNYFHQGSTLGDADVLLLSTPVQNTSSAAMWFLISTGAGSGLALLLFLSSVAVMRSDRLGRAGRAGLLLFYRNFAH